MSRDAILASLRQHNLDPVAHPGLPDSGLTYENPVESFGNMLEAIGGRFERAGDKSIPDIVRLHYPDPTILASAIEEIPSSGIDLNTINDPHHLEKVDVAVISGGVAVAENGAIWVTAASAVHRALPFITQHLVIVIPIDRIVSNMHQAYAHETVTPADEGFGVWISGPSKTADIEQSLVIGAHGSRSLLVIGT